MRLVYRHLRLALWLQDAQTVRVKLKPLLSREELLAELRKRNPGLFAAVTDESQALLKGGQPTGQPPSWP